MLVKPSFLRGWIVLCMVICASIYFTHSTEIKNSASDLQWFVKHTIKDWFGESVGSKEKDKEYLDVRAEKGYRMIRGRVVDCRRRSCYTSIIVNDGGMRDRLVFVHHIDGYHLNIRKDDVIEFPIGKSLNPRDIIIISRKIQIYSE